MLKAAPPGRAGFTLTKEAFSVEPVPAAECAPSTPSCPNARRSSFYGTWVRKESEESGAARYRIMATELGLEVEHSLKAEGTRWGTGDDARAFLAGIALGIQVNESGQREDVVMGRGRSGRVKPTDKQYDDAGGQGRGPSNEACVMQILPRMAAAYGGSEALLGLSHEALSRCYRAGLDQITYSARMCSLEKRRFGDRTVTRLYATVSRYGNGFSCTSSNGGKTEARVESASWMIAELRRLLRKG